MRRSNPLGLGGLILLAVLATACAEPPTEEAQTAEAAVQAARDAEAGVYAPESLRLTESSLEAAQQEIQTQNERFAIMRDYEEAIKMLTETVSQAGTARSDAEAAKEEARQEAEARFESVRAAIADADMALEGAPRGKGTKADIAALKADLDGIRLEVSDLEEKISAEEYFDAQDKADTIIAAAVAVSDEIKAAVEMQAKILEQRRSRR